MTIKELKELLKSIGTREDFIDKSIKLLRMEYFYQMDLKRLPTIEDFASEIDEEWVVSNMKLIKKIDYVN